MLMYYLYGKGEIIAGDSFMRRRPAPYSLEAIAGSYLLLLDFHDMEEIYKQFPSTQEIARMLVFSREAEDVNYRKLLLGGAKARVRYFYNRFPELCLPGKPVRDTDIASYLGITVRTLRTCRDSK